MRTCVGCGTCRPKKELVRIVRTADGEVLPDRTGRANGRGAYLCDNPSCIALARKKKSLSRAFEIPLSPEVYEMLERELAGGTGDA